MSMGLSKLLGLLGFSGSDHPTSAERRSSDSRDRHEQEIVGPESLGRVEE